MLKRLGFFFCRHNQAFFALSLMVAIAYYSQHLHSAFAQEEINPYESRLKNIATNDISKWMNSPVIVEAIKEQNKKHNILSLIEIEKLDRKWKLQVNNINRPMVEKIRKTPTSLFLSQKQYESDGLYREIMVIDNRGLIVANSVTASDYWQGDENKWMKTFKVGSGAIFIDRVKYDDSAQAFQAQVSLTISEGDEPIGSITVGVDTEKMDFGGR